MSAIKQEMQKKVNEIQDLLITQSSKKMDLVNKLHEVGLMITDEHIVAQIYLDGQLKKLIEHLKQGIKEQELLHIEVSKLKLSL
jgi:hypothetical protein